MNFLSLRSRYVNFEQQKTIGSLTDTIDEMKAHCKAVDEVNEKMKCCGNCKHNTIGKYAELYCEECRFFGIPNQNMDKWELPE